MTFRQSKLLWSIQAALLATSSLAFAADNTEDDDDAKLEKILVTAQKRVENAQEVPVSITALKGDALQALAAAGQDVRFMSARVPSLTIESSFGRTFPRFYIRGLGNTDFDLNASQPVSLIFDDVVQENPILKGFPVFDTDRVEVLRGPQGSLFGRNTTAGIVKFDSKKPSQAFDGYLSASYGTYDTINLEGAVGGALTDTLSARLSLLDQRRDDWVDNKAPGFEKNDQLEGYHDQAGRLQLLWEPSEDFSALFNAHFRELDGTPRVFRANIVKVGSDDFVDGFDRDTVYQDAAARATQDLSSRGGSIKLEYNLGDYTLTSITGYESAEVFSRGDIDGGYGASYLPTMGPGFIPFTSESADGLPDHSQWTQELRLSSNELGALDYQLGLFYFDESLNIDSFNYDGNGVENGYAYQEQDAKSWAVFGSADYDLSDDFKVIAGLRYSHDKKDYVAQRLLSPNSADGVGPTARLHANPSDSQLSWDLSGVYSLNDDINFYGRLAKGYRAPSIQGRLLFGDEITVADSETLHSIEFGVKADVLDNRGRVNFATFYYQVDDQQLTAVGGGANFNRIINADKSVGYGFELDSQFAVTRNLLLTAGVSYNNTEIQDDDLAIDACHSGCTVTDPLNSDGLALIDGNALPHAPKWIANITASYSYPLAQGELFVYTDWAYRSKISFFLYESREYQDKYLLEGGLRAGYRWSSGDRDYEVAAYGRNITNDESRTGGIDFNNLTGFVNDPRIVGVEFKASFF
ncbi:TonB-dependent receptor [Gallaecimonas xiamenensis]|uniref:TonB-dependent receptor n=1 Tax=Gallaecimonas xiamenensis 3-C-1 TaxID=745411 RepID=K2JQ50_9GAMM|nr:TonB-dependent receptor [Gallaecimonas xiamenensis]EKE77418.1 TonB-dependent receptor [Gallaecimonas xiamenensis 3-C-1]